MTLTYEFRNQEYEYDADIDEAISDYLIPDSCLKNGKEYRQGCSDTFKHVMEMVPYLREQLLEDDDFLDFAHDYFAEQAEEQFNEENGEDEDYYDEDLAWDKAMDDWRGDE